MGRGGCTVKRCLLAVVWPFNLQTHCSCLFLTRSVDSPMGNFSWTRWIKTIFFLKKWEREGNVLGRLRGESRGRVISRRCLNVWNDLRINKRYSIFFKKKRFKLRALPNLDLNDLRMLHLPSLDPPWISNFSLPLWLCDLLSFSDASRCFLPQVSAVGLLSPDLPSLLLGLHFISRVRTLGKALTPPPLS